MIKAERNITINVTICLGSYACNEYFGSVKKKLKTSTLKIEELMLYILLDTTNEVNKTPRIYMVIILASLNPKY